MLKKHETHNMIFSSFVSYS